MKMINGQIVPESLTLSELEELMESSNMQTFAVACEALRLVNTQEAYELLKKYLYVSDQYKRRCVLAVIYDYNNASELVSELVQALNSEEHFLVTTALDNIIQGKIHVADEQVLACIERNHGKLNSYYYCVLTCIERTEENIERILNLYHTCKEDSVRIAMAESLYSFCNPNNYLRLFNLFKDDSVAHIRMVACRIAIDRDRGDLLQNFKQDKDGHIRKLALSK